MNAIAAWLFEGEFDNGMFAAPGFLWLLLLVPALALLMWGMGRLHNRRLARLFRGDLRDRVRPPSVRRRRTARDVLLLCTLILGIIAMAGPRFDKQVQLIKAKGVDLVLVVDLSRSMDATDVDPSRLERVRREISDLIELLEGDRVGLVIFAGGAYARMPLSEDHQALKMLVDEMSTRDFQAQGSAMGEAITVAADLLTKDETSRAGKAAILFSDGEVHDPAAALKAAGEARARGVRLFAMGVGEAAAPIPLGQGLWQEDRQGRRVLTTPSSDLLKEIARIGGGSFHGSEASNADVRRLYQQQVRGLLEAGVRSMRPKVRWRSAWGWPLGGAVLCVLISAWLGEGRRRWGMAAAVVFAVGIVFSAPAEAASLGEADDAYRQGQYEKAVRILTELTYDQPENSDLFDRLGAARYRQGDFEGAARAWDRERGLQGQPDSETLFDLGNAHARSGRYERALEIYDSLLQKGAYPKAKTNRDLIAGELERRRAQQQQQQEQQEQEGDPSEDGESEDGETSDSDGGQQGGEPQDGDQKPKDPEEQEDGEEGDPEEGGEQGEPPPEGEGSSAEGERERTDREQSGDNDSQQTGGRKQVGDDQERKDESDSEGVAPSELDGAGESVEGGESGDTAPGELDNPEEAAARRARKMLEGVEEGRPRVTIPGGSGDKPW